MSNFGGHDILGALRPLQRYARALTRDAVKAEDLVHDTLLRAIERGGTYRESESLTNWLRSILHNTFIDERRRADAHGRHVRQLSFQTENETAPDQESHLQLQQVAKMFDQLPDEQRAALYLVAVEDMTYSDAAKTLNIPLGTLMSRIGRARDALRSLANGDVDVASSTKLRLLRTNHD